MRTLNIFLSSPGDVGQERLLASRVISRLQGEFANYFEINCILWEDKPLEADSHFQNQIAQDLLSTDIFVCILWTRLGTQLPSNFIKVDGTPYLSGTEWEFETALKLKRETGKPLMLVYRKTRLPDYCYNDAKRQESESQRKLLEGFWQRFFGDHITGFKAASHSFDNVDEFEEKLETHLRELLRQQVPNTVAETMQITPKWFSGSPFRGLEVFNREHAPVFFGRTKGIGDIKELLVKQAGLGCPFLMVFGRSGCGKSSLIRAGVIPTIIHPGVIEGVDLWYSCILRPGDGIDDLCRGLTIAILSATDGDGNLLTGLEEEMFYQCLSTNLVEATEVLIGAMGQVAAKIAKKQGMKRPMISRLLIFIDQMEEIFDVDDRKRKKFIEVLSHFVHSGLVWVIGTMRSDYYHRCIEIPELITLKSGTGQYDLLPPSFAEIGSIIVKPAHAAGLFFERDITNNQRLDQILHEEAAKNPSSLPLLEFTLEELYKRREGNVLTFKAYDCIGGMEGALARHADSIFAELTPNAQAAFPQVLRSLVTVEQGEEETVGCRRVLRDSLPQTLEGKALVDAFVATRLFVIDTNKKGQVVVGFAHAAILKSWPRIQEWLAGEKDFLRARSRLTETTNRWLEENKRNEYLLAEGKPLSDALELLKKYKEDLGYSIVQYIQASWHYLKGRKRRKRILSTIALIFLITGFYTFLRTSWGEKLVELRHNIETVVLGRMDLAAAEQFGWISDEIAFIDIDHETYKQWGHSDITPRDRLAELIDVAYNGGAKVIALDIFLQDPDYQHPEKDERLREVLQAIKKDEQGAKIIFPVTLSTEGILGKTLYDDLIDNKERFFKAVPWVMVASSYDNKMRFWTPYGVYIREDKEQDIVWGTPVLATVLASGDARQLTEFSNRIIEGIDKGDDGKDLHFTSKKEGKELVRISSGSKVTNYRINYSLIPPGVLKKEDPGNLFMKAFTVHQLQKMMNLNKNLLRNKIVIIGNSSPDKRDNYPTPVGTMPGMYIHGNVINTILNGL